MRLLCSLLGTLFFVVACAGSFDAGKDMTAFGDQFSEAMRWQDYLGAANLLHADVRKDFLDQFQQDDDLRVVESRIVSIDLNAEIKVATADFRLEFYRLPSMRVKKWQWSQEWQLQQQKGFKSPVWLIVNPPPPLP